MKRKFQWLDQHRVSSNDRKEKRQRCGTRLVKVYFCNDVLSCILEYLNLQQKANCNLVCRQWHTFIESESMYWSKGDFLEACKFGVYHIVEKSLQLNKYVNFDIGLDLAVGLDDLGVVSLLVGDCRLKRIPADILENCLYYDNFKVFNFLIKHEKSPQNFDDFFIRLLFMSDNENFLVSFISSVKLNNRQIRLIGARCSQYSKRRAMKALVKYHS